MCKFSHCLIALAAMSMATIVAAQSTSTMSTYGPFTGDAGYQEIKLANQSWYVAYQGNQQMSLRFVNAGWQARVVELCAPEKAEYYVELRYVGEPVRIIDRTGLSDDLGRETLMPVGGRRGVYAPVQALPSRQVESPAPTLDAPSKLAAAMCLDTPSRLKDASRAVPISKAREQIRDAGIQINPRGDRK